MAIVQISRIQHRRGLQEDLSQLASGELGWSTDTQQLWIGNGTADEYSPIPNGKTEILTQYSILNFESGFTSNVANLQANVSTLQSQVSSLGGLTINTTLGAGTTGHVALTTGNNAVVTYTLTQGSTQRTGTLTMARNGSTVTSTEDYVDTGTTNAVFTFSANSAYGSWDYTTTTATNLSYQIQQII